MVLVVQYLCVLSQDRLLVSGDRSQTSPVLESRTASLSNEPSTLNRSSGMLIRSPRGSAKANDESGNMVTKNSTTGHRDSS
jgi:hypothetical protein